MEYYCAFVKTGFDRIFKEEAQKKFAELDTACIFYSFTRQLWIGKAKKGRMSDELFFPGYVFFCCTALTEIFFERLKKIQGFVRLLQSNTNVIQIKDKDYEILRNFLSLGEHHPMSTVEYDENDRIRILSGDMANFEGCIKKFDRRKQRVTVELTTTHFSYTFDLCYVVVQKLN